MIIIFSKWLNSSIWPIDRILTGTTTLIQSVPENNGNEGVLHIPKLPDWSLTIRCSFFYQDGYGIKLTTKVYVPLKQKRYPTPSIFPILKYFMYQRLTLSQHLWCNEEVLPWIETTTGLQPRVLSKEEEKRIQLLQTIQFYPPSKIISNSFINNRCMLKSQRKTTHEKNIT